MFYQLPPVGNPVVLSISNQPESYLRSIFSPYQSSYFASGTAALAAAITAAIRIHKVESPEVILPAYGCPDLVSATIYAGAKPVLVDLEPDRPWMDLEKVAASISSQTVAILAASLCGISERLSQLRSIVEQKGIALIEDSAQAFPSEDETGVWAGDLVVLSFGRGKPVSLLGGGAVLFRENRFGELLPAGPKSLDAGWINHVLFRLKAGFYNRMISPDFFWLPQSMPFLHLGETRYHPLKDIEAMDEVRLAMLPANIAAYRDNGMETQRTLGEMLAEMDAKAVELIDLPEACKLKHDRRLLRYPLLVNASIRDRLYRQLIQSGLGPSCMYPEVLPCIPGLENTFEGQGTFPAAESFAKRILTLPTHQQVRAKDLVNIRRILCST